MPHDIRYRDRTAMEQKHGAIGTAAGTWQDYVALLRPGDWSKNLFVLAPLLFSGNFRNAGAMEAALLAAIAFTVVSATTYVWNDLCDRADDVMHPVKRHTRAIAAGRIPVAAGRAYLVFMLVLSAGMLYLTPSVAPVALAYLAVQTAYGLVLRKVPVLDLFAIASGFVFRVMAGSAAIDVKTSSWMFVATASLALYLAASKRLAEMRSSGNQARLALQRYDEPMLEFFTHASAFATTIFYVLFTVLGRPVLLHTSLFVSLGTFRYHYATRRNPRLETPSEILRNDKLLLGIVLLWVIDCAVVLYLFPPPPLL